MFARIVERDDQALNEPCSITTEIVVERLIACGSCRLLWWARAGSTTSHVCSARRIVEPFVVPL
jgi:hypothetical protein